jgi:hypothetical protein
MRTVKFFAWEKNFYSRICEIRQRELKRLRVVRIFESLTDFFWYGTPVIITVRHHHHPSFLFSVVVVNVVNDDDVVVVVVVVGKQLNCEL